MTERPGSPEGLRPLVAKVLDWEDAHAGFDAAVSGIPPEARGVRPKGLQHSAWELLEHIRICQRDILDFCRNPAYVELSMKDYWPQSATPSSDTAWDESAASFRRDREALQRLAGDPAVDLFAVVPPGTTQTYLRELLLAADHNAYHVGQLVLVRRLLGAWPAP
jgi:uncharacterized damage-inducible protein DinB